MSGLRLSGPSTAPVKSPENHFNPMPGQSPMLNILQTKKLRLLILPCSIDLSIHPSIYPSIPPSLSLLTPRTQLMTSKKYLTFFFCLYHQPFQFSCCSGNRQLGYVILNFLMKRNIVYNLKLKKINSLEKYLTEVNTMAFLSLTVCKLLAESFFSFLIITPFPNLLFMNFTSS